MAALSIPEDGLLAFPPHRENLSYSTRIVDSEDQKREVRTRIYHTNGFIYALCVLCVCYQAILDILKRSVDHPQLRAAEEHYSKSGFAATKTKTKLSERLPQTILYVWRRDEAESMSEYLRASGISASAYHAGMVRFDS
jgi:superfamily II DNA helicase RecQ